MGKKIIFIILACFIFCTAAYADQPEPEAQAILEPSVIQPLPQPSQNAPKLFSLGRSMGAAYFHLIDLCDKSENKPFSELQQEYSDTFQNFNVIDIVLEDLNIQGKSRQDLHKLRLNFYNSLKNQDLNETQIAFVQDMFVIFYENLTQDVTARYCFQGSWLLSLGFYSSFQLESLNSPGQEKILLSGFGRIFNARPVSVPENIYASLLAVNNLDKLSVTQAELAILKTSLMNITEYFTNYPESRPLFNEIQDLVGVWQGILINPENEKHDIRLIVNKDLNATMDISGIAGKVAISDIHIVNNYFTFMFKPFGTEKLHMRFDARLSDNIFTGEITDVLGAKGYWVLAKTDKNCKLSEEKLDTMVSYIAWIEEKLKTLPVIPEIPVNEINMEEIIIPDETTVVIDEATLPVLEDELELKDEQEKIITEEPVSEVKKKGFWNKLKSFFGSCFKFLRP